jgi:hypothetical protein
MKLDQSAGAGHVIHSTVALPEEAVYFVVVKDLSHGIPADGEDTGGYYSDGFEPEK